MKISFKLTLAMVVTILISLGISSVALVTTASSEAEDLSRNLIRLNATSVSGAFADFLGSYWRQAEVMTTMAQSFQVIPANSRREYLYSSMAGMLRISENIVSVWIVMEPDGLGDNDSTQLGQPGTNAQGRFIPSFIRKTTGQIVTELKGANISFENEPFYRLPLDSGTQIITDPYSRQLAGEMRSLVTISAPVRLNSGEVVGALGIDIDADGLQDIGQNIERVFAGSVRAAYTSNGIVVSNKDPSRLKTSMMEYGKSMFGPYLGRVQDAFENGRLDAFDYDWGDGLMWISTVPVKIGDSSNTWNFIIGVPEKEVLSSVRTMVWISIGIVILMILLSSAIAFVLARRIAKPIISMADSLNDIANGEGDLTVKLPDRANDETGDACRYFNQTMGKIRDLVVSIKGQAGTLSNIGNDLASNMTQTAAAMNEITATMQSIKGRILNQSASVTQTNATMEQVTVNIDKLSGHVERQTSAVSQSSTAIEEMIANIQSVTTTLVKNAHNVKELQESSEVGRSSLQDVVSDIKDIARESEGILEINAVMENIASQTNLLSMNAAIEAAHAGEAGKGFAVVADEIRKLAESSSEQSKTIGSVLKKIRESMDRITHSTDNVLEKFEKIDLEVKTVAEQEETIRNAMEEQSHGSQQILTASGQVSEITQQVKGGSMEMLEGSREVIQESKNLEKATQEITNGINEMAIGADEVNTAVNNVNKLSDSNRESISRLVKAVSRFKV